MIPLNHSRALDGDLYSITSSASLERPQSYDGSSDIPTIGLKESSPSEQHHGLVEDYLRLRNKIFAQSEARVQTTDYTAAAGSVPLPPSSLTKEAVGYELDPSKRDFDNGAEIALYRKIEQDNNKIQSLLTVPVAKIASKNDDQQEELHSESENNPKDVNNSKNDSNSNNIHSELFAGTSLNSSISRFIEEKEREMDRLDRERDESDQLFKEKYEIASSNRNLNIIEYTNYLRNSDKYTNPASNDENGNKNDADNITTSPCLPIVTTLNKTARSSVADSNNQFNAGSSSIRLSNPSLSRGRELMNTDVVPASLSIKTSSATSEFINNLTSEEGVNRSKNSNELQFYTHQTQQQQIPRVIYGSSTSSGFDTQTSNATIGPSQLSSDGFSSLQNVALRINQLEDSIQSLQSAISSLKIQNNSLESEVQQEKQNLDFINKKIKARAAQRESESRAVLSVLCDQVEGKKMAAEEQAKLNEETRKKLDQDKQAINARKLQLSQEIASLKEENLRIREKNAGLEGEAKHQYARSSDIQANFDIVKSKKNEADQTLKDLLRLYTTILFPVDPCEQIRVTIPTQMDSLVYKANSLLEKKSKTAQRKKEVKTELAAILKATMLDELVSLKQNIQTHLKKIIQNPVEEFRRNSADTIYLNYVEKIQTKQTQIAILEKLCSSE